MSNLVKIHTEYILGVRVDFGYSLNTAVKRIESLLHEKGTHLVCTTNAEFIMDAQNNSEFKEIINNSTLSLPDSAGVVFAKEYTDNIIDVTGLLTKFIAGIKTGLSSQHKYEKVTGVDLFYSLCELASQKGYTVALIGGWPKDKFGRSKVGEYDIAKDTSEIVSKMYPGLNVVYASSKYSFKEKDDAHQVQEIQQSMKNQSIERIDFLFAAYGHFKQERWINRNLDKVPAKVGIGVGGTFDYVTNNMKRPNKDIRDKNLEWFYRLVTQPWRIKRVLKAFPLFPTKVFLNTIKNK